MMQPDGWRGVGWEVATCRRFVHDGRNWAAVERFYRGLTAGEHDLACLGLQLVEAPEGAAAAVGAAHPGGGGGGGGSSVGRAAGPTLCEAAVVPPEPSPTVAAAPAARHSRRRTPRERLTYKVAVSYFGPAFQGWSWQKDVRNTLEETLRGALAGLSLGQQVVVSTAGRTDRGVSAYRQTVSFYTWDEAATPQAVLAALNTNLPPELRAWHAGRVPRAFHATFQARWRRYLYLFPLAPDNGSSPAGSNGLQQQEAVQSSADEAAAVGVDAARVHSLLQALVGADLDCTAIARDTPAGKGCVCRLLAARAWHAKLPPVAAHGTGCPVVAVELVGDRFLKRMVRVLVATAIREAVPGAAWFPAGVQCGAAAGPAQLNERALLEVLATGDRLRSAPPAPAVGLCFLEAGYCDWPAGKPQ